MANIFSNLSVVRKDRLKNLKTRERSYFDLEFVKAMPPKWQSACLENLDRSKSQIRQDLFALCQLDFKENGFFVEFGATDGIAHSNTLLLEDHFG